MISIRSIGHFEYLAPGSLAEALQILEAEGANGKILNGGTGPVVGRGSVAGLPFAPTLSVHAAGVRLLSLPMTPEAILDVIKGSMSSF